MATAWRTLRSTAYWPEILGVVAVLLAGFMRRLLLAAENVEFLVQYVVDDAFYYLQVARNLTSGAGVTFDGIHLTNGFHPLWLVIVSFLALFFDEAVALLRAALVTGALLSLVSAILLYLILKRLTGLWWLALIGVAVFFLGQFSLQSSLNGLETALSLFLLLCALYLVIGRAGSELTRRQSALLGLVLGALFLARTDNVFLILAIILIVSIESGAGERWRRLAIIGVAGALVAGPWLLWNWLQFGTPMQASGVAYPYLLRENHLLDGYTRLDGVGHGLRLLAGFLLTRRDISLLAILSFFLVLLNRRPYFRERDSLRRRAIWQSALLWAAFMMLVFIHTYVRWLPRPWYFDASIVLALITLSLVLTIPPLWVMASKAVRTSERYVPARYGRYLGLLILAGGLITLARSQFRDLSSPIFADQIESYEAAQWLRDNTESTDRAAAFNAGVIGYFSGRTVINLDGVINNDAFEAIRDKALFCYLEEISAVHYADFDPRMLDIYKYHLGEARCPLDLVAVAEFERVDKAPTGARVRIFRLE